MNTEFGNAEYNLIVSQLFFLLTHLHITIEPTAEKITHPPVRYGNDEKLRYW